MTYTREQLESMKITELWSAAVSLGLSKKGKAVEIIERILTAGEQPNKSTESEDKPKNVAMIVDGTKEVRRYTLAMHGEAFQDMAVEYLSKLISSNKKGNYSIKLIGERDGIICPGCGHFIAK